MKLNILKLTLCSLGIFAISHSVTAQEKKGPNFNKIQKKLDADKDGSITLEEFKSVKRKKEVSAEKLEKKYAILDGNKDGSVTLAELKENWAKTKKKKKKKA